MKLSLSRLKPHKPRSWKRFFLALVLCGVWFGVWLVVVTLMVLATGYVAGLQSGFDAYGNTTGMQDTQVLFWITVWCLLIFGLAYRLLGRSKRLLLRTGHFTLGFVIVLGLIISVIGLPVMHNNAVHSAKLGTGSCDSVKTLQDGIGATYPIETDRATGTAFAVDDHGTLVTAYHVIAGAKEAHLSLTTGNVPVTVLRVAPAYDLALLRVAMPTPAHLTISTQYAPADEVYALGWPANTFEVGQSSISRGIISRTIPGSDGHGVDASIPTDMKFIQTDAAINPGNSGGPLINKCGVVGVIDAISEAQVYEGLPREEGIAYAISSDTIKTALGL